ncbi:tetratricopeptide repeat protein [Marinilabiliaceae bacterium N1Y90]|nr:tetratricopeptide repeat protein [Marinilabiliaceae bacterium N1Y90]
MFAGYNVTGQNFEKCKCDSIIIVLETKSKTDSAYYSNLILAFNSCDDPYLRLSFSKEALDYATLIENSQQIGYAHLMVGLAYQKLGLLKDAYNSFLNALTEYENTHNESGYINSCYYLARILAKDNRFEDAIIYSSKTLELYKSNGDSIRYASILLNIGEYNRNLGHYVQAKESFSESINIFKIKKYDFGVAYGYGNIGLVYLAQDSLSLAVENLNKSLEILEPLSDNYSVSVYQEGLAHVYQKQKQYKKAEALALQSLALALEDHLIEQIRDANFRLSEIYKESGAHLKAYQSHVAYVN